MLLAIDAGNTNVVFALVDDGNIRARWRIATDPRRTADEYAVWLNQLLNLEGFAMQDVKDVIIATVVPRALHNLQVLSQKYFKVDAAITGEASAPWDVTLDVEEPGSVGADRVVNAIAAHHLYPGDLIVIDFGTATTFDVVDYTGAYKGGIIAPGINLSLDALVQAAERNPLVSEGYARPHPQFIYAGMSLQRRLIVDLSRTVRELGGGAFQNLPSSEAAFLSPETREHTERYYRSTAAEARDRVKLLRLIWDFIGTEYGGRQLQYEMFYSAAQPVVNRRMFRAYDWAAAKAMVDRLLAEY